MTAVTPAPSLLLPVLLVVDRLRTRARLTTLVALLVLPALIATWSFASVLGGQVDFAGSERRGVTVVRPALEALADTAAGRPVDLTGLRAAVEQHPDLDAGDALRAVSSAVQAGDGPEQRAGTAQALAALITAVGDSSKLILDPDLDSFYVMDVLVVQLPRALTATAQTATTAPASTGAGPGQAGTGDRVASRAVLAGALTGAAAAVRADLETAARTTTSPSLQDRTAPAAVGADAVAALAEQVSEALDAPTPLEAAARTRVGDAALTSVGPLADALDGLLEARRDGLAERRAWTLGLTVTGLVLAGWLAAAVIWRTRHDVGLAVAAAGAISAGDLRAQALPAGSDELGDIGRALDGARARVQELLRSVDADTAVLHDASATLVAVSTELRTSALRSADQTDVVAASACEVSEGVRSVSDGTAQMAIAVQEISSSTSAAVAVTAEAMRMAAFANDSVAKLERSSAEISTVLSLIGSIAAQTNLLALNATIEAARAGDYGKGFAVVANEVKQLAQQTAAATGQVGRQVAAIQADAGGAVTSLSRMRDITCQIDDHQGTIAAAVEEQTVTTAQITRSLVDAADGSRSIAETVQGVAQAAGRTNDCAEQTASAACSVTEVSDRLRDQLRAFTC